MMVIYDAEGVLCGKLHLKIMCQPKALLDPDMQSLENDFDQKSGGECLRQREVKHD